MIRPHVGNRGSCLLAFAAVDVVWAVYLLTSPESATTRWFDAVIPIEFWAGVWVAVGLLCTIFAFRRDDHVGFVAAIGIKIVWGTGCLMGWALSDVPLGAVGIWTGFAWLVWRISGWAEPQVISEDQPREP